MIDNEVEKVWIEFWKPICCNENGEINLEQIKKELNDYKFILDQVPKVYCYITGGKMSKPNYFAEDVISVSDEYTKKLIEEGIEEAIEEYKSYNQ